MSKDYKFQDIKKKPKEPNTLPLEIEDWIDGKDGPTRLFSFNLPIKLRREFEQKVRASNEKSMTEVLVRLIKQYIHT